MRMIKSKTMRWEVYVASKGTLRNAYIILIEKPEGKWPHLDIRITGESCRAWTRLISPRTWPSGVLL
jgi:hypothetical protein